MYIFATESYFVTSLTDLQSVNNPNELGHIITQLIFAMIRRKKFYSPQTCNSNSQMQTQVTQ